MDYKSIVEEKRARLERIRKQRADSERIPSASHLPDDSSAKKTEIREKITSNSVKNDGNIEKILKELLPVNTGTPQLADLEKRNTATDKEAEKENSLKGFQSSPSSQPIEKNNHFQHERVMLEKSIQTPDNWYLEEEMLVREKEIEREVKHNLEKELRRKLEAEYQAKYEKLLLDAQKHKIDDVEEAPILEGYETTLQEFEENLEKDSEYAQATNLADYASSSMSLLSLPDSFSDRDIIEDRSMLYIDTSPFFPELVLVSYSSASEESQRPQGLVIVWNTQKKEKEFTFLAQTVIVVAQFSKSKSNQIYGCGDNGLLYLWDFSSISRYPVLQTQPDYKSENQHFQPIIELYQTQNASNSDKASNSSLITSMLITVSSDGLICFWSPDLISKTLKNSLKIKFPSDHAYLEITSMSVLPSDPGFLLIGTSFGYIYRVHLFENMDHKIGVDMENIFFGHTQAPVMSISPINSSSMTNSSFLTGLFLTSGSDFSIRVHQLDTFSKSKFAKPQDNNRFISTASIDSDKEYVQPLLILNTENFTMDAQWRPNHISQFASVDSSGFIQIWDLCKNRMRPIDSLDLSEVIKKVAKARKRGLSIGANDGEDDDNYDHGDDDNNNNDDDENGIEEGDTTADITVDEYVEELGLNRLGWSSDGSKLFVGGLDGKLYSFSCTSDFNKPDNNSTYVQFKSILKS